MTPDEILQEKQRLIFLLEAERRKSLEVLKEANPRMMVHVASGWRVMDLLAHLAAWEREVLAAVQAFDEGEAYSIEGFDLERYNQTQYERRRTLDPAQIRMDWAMVRRDVQDVIHDLHAERFEESMTYPSGRTGPVIPLLEYLAEHEAEHREEIVRALAAARLEATNTVRTR